MSTIKVMLAEDHVITRQGISRVLEDEKDLEVVGEAGDGEEAVQMVTALQPDVVIMDIAMPRLNGIEATKQIKLVYPAAAVLILSAYDDDEYVFGLLKAGAAGYLLKTISGDQLVEAVRAVQKGESVLDTIITNKVMQHFRNHEDGAKRSAPADVLTEREMDIIKLAAGGMSNKSIASELKLSKRTVEGHLRAIFNKLVVGSRIEAVLYGLKKGWFSLHELD